MKVKDLRKALRGVDGDVRVQIGFYDESIEGNEAVADVGSVTFDDEEKTFTLNEEE